MSKYTQYKGHDVVGALKIASVNELGINKARFTLESSPMHAEELSFEEHPFVRGVGVGDYLIEHRDGHFSYIPAAEFEGSYVKLEKQPSEETPLRPAERQEQDMKMRDLANKATTLEHRGEDLPAEGLPAERDIVTHKVPDLANVKLPKSDSPDPLKWPGDEAGNTALEAELAKGRELMGFDSKSEYASKADALRDELAKGEASPVSKDYSLEKTTAKVEAEHAKHEKHHGKGHK